MTGAKWYFLTDTRVVHPHIELTRVYWLCRDSWQACVVGHWWLTCYNQISCLDWRVWNNVFRITTVQVSTVGQCHLRMDCWVYTWVRGKPHQSVHWHCPFGALWCNLRLATFVNRFWYLVRVNHPYVPLNSLPLRDWGEHYRGYLSVNYLYIDWDRLFAGASSSLSVSGSKFP